MADFIPSGDAEFDTWQDTLENFIGDAANRTRLGLTPAQTAPLDDKQGAWTSAYPAHVAAQSAALVASNAKNAARAAYEAPIRTFIAVLQRNPALTDADRTALKITIPATTRQNSAVPTTFPIPTVDFAVRLQHSISFRDSQTPDSKAKPDGVRGAQIYEKIGGPLPASPDEFTFLGTDTRAPYVCHFEMGDIGKTVYYLLHWENTTGKTGPWSEITSAVVPG